MKETRMPPAQAANLVENNGNTIYGVSVILQLTNKDPATIFTCMCQCHLWQCLAKQTKEYHRQHHFRKEQGDA